LRCEGLFIHCVTSDNTLILHMCTRYPLEKINERFFCVWYVYTQVGVYTQCTQYFLLFVIFIHPTLLIWTPVCCVCVVHTHIS